MLWNPTSASPELPVVATRAEWYALVIKLIAPLAATAVPFRGFSAHLQSAGFGGAPRPLGFDEKGHEMVSWIEGIVPTPASHAWATTEDALQARENTYCRFS